MKLIGNLTSPFVRKVRIVAAEKRVEYEWQPSDPWDESSTLWQINPLGQVPVLVLDDGTTLFDSRVICEFLDTASPITRLLPQGNRERIEVKRWEALADGMMDASVLALLESRRPKRSQRASWIARQRDKVRHGLDAMESALARHNANWCCGNTYTLADVAAAACLGYLDFRHPDLEWRGERPALARLAARLAERSSIIDTAPPR